jgi:hypothetical protein
MPDIPYHPWPLRWIPEEATGVQFVDQMDQKIIQPPLGRDGGFIRHQFARRGRVICRPPFIRHDQHRLRQVQRHERRIERKPHQSIRLRHVVVVQPRPFGAEQQPRAQTPAADFA